MCAVLLLHKNHWLAQQLKASCRLQQHAQTTNAWSVMLDGVGADLLHGTVARAALLYCGIDCNATILASVYRMLISLEQQITILYTDARIQAATVSLCRVQWGI